MADLPIVCTLQPGDLNARAAQLLPGLAARASSREPIDNGIRLRFSATPEILSAALTAIEAERQCCRFLRFQLIVEPEDGPILLDITGPAGTSEFLEALIEPA